MPKEKTFKDLSPTAKRGLTKFASLPSSKMQVVKKRFRAKTGQNPSNIFLKEKFFSFVAKQKRI